MCPSFENFIGLVIVAMAIPLVAATFYSYAQVGHG